MNWDAIGAVGEILSAIAVVITLVYLTRQIRQSNVSAQSSAVQAFEESMTNSMVPLTQDTELIEINRNGMADWHSLSKNEQTQLHSLWVIQIMRIHMGFGLWQKGTLDYGSYNSWAAGFAATLATSGGATWWDNHKQWMEADFVEDMHEKISEARPMYDATPWWSKENTSP